MLTGAYIITFDWMCFSLARKQVQELGLVAVYNHIPQIRSTIRRLMSLGFVPLPSVRMCLGNLQRAASPLQVQAPALADLFLYLSF